MQTAQQKKREEILDKEWIEDLVFVHKNIHSCDEVDTMLEVGDFSWWPQCPNCGAERKEDGTITHRMQ